MIIEIIKCLKDNYSYLIIDEKLNTACVVDPSESRPIINYLEDNQINLKFILNTHHHYDHCIFLLLSYLEVYLIFLLNYSFLQNKLIRETFLIILALTQNMFL